MLFAGEVVQKRCPQPPHLHPVNLPASYCSGHNPTYLLLKLVRACLFVWSVFIRKAGRSSSDSVLHLSGFLCAVSLCLLLLVLSLLYWRRRKKKLALYWIRLLNLRTFTLCMRPFSNK